MIKSPNCLSCCFVLLPLSYFEIKTFLPAHAGFGIRPLLSIPCNFLYIKGYLTFRHIQDPVLRGCSLAKMSLSSKNLQYYSLNDIGTLKLPSNKATSNHCAVFRPFTHAAKIVGCRRFSSLPHQFL